MKPIIDLGIISIHWYSIIIFVAILIGSNLAIKEAKRYGYEEDFVVNLLFLGVILGIIGARIYYVIFNFDYYKYNLIEIFKVWNGGLAIHGGIIAGFITIAIICYKKKVNLLRILDYLVVGLIIAQAIGRWGNFFNGEAHGPATTLAYLEGLHLPQFIIDGMNIGGNYYIPTFLYESVWCLIGFIVMIILRRRKFMKVGYLTSFYLVWYGIERFYVEGMRTDSLMFLTLKVAQIVSLCMIVIGFIVFIYSFRKKIKYEGGEGNA